jgi:(S)-3,5-dihydroxyphenylglycine transaminase
MSNDTSLTPQEPGKPDFSRLSVMNFLNEMAENFPNASSFASGRPAERFFDMAQWIECLPNFYQHFAAMNNIAEDGAKRILAQYGRTNGIINDLIACQAAADEGVQCEPSQIIVTSGCQEAISLCVQQLCRDDGDVLLARSPCYIGITGVADLNGIEIVPFACGAGISVPEMFSAIEAVRKQGKRPRALYLVPDFDNPTGTVLSRQEREDIITVCTAMDIVILEDNPYGMFRYEGAAVPPMYALDQAGCVIYLGTYSKTICPALRIGYAVIPLKRAGLMEKLSQAKSFATVNTSQILQAIAGAVLLQQGCSLRRLVAPAVNFYRQNRDAMLDALEINLSAYAPQVSWNAPQGGFFLVVTLPFPFLRTEAEQCAREYRVLTMPLSFFSLGREQDRQVRLAFSNSNPDAIRAGVERFSHFVKWRIDLDAT